MNKKQKITMWVAVGVLALMLLVPPWKYVYSSGGRSASEGHASWSKPSRGHLRCVEPLMCPPPSHTTPPPPHRSTALDADA